MERRHHKALSLVAFVSGSILLHMVSRRAGVNPGDTRIESPKPTEPRNMNGSHPSAENAVHQEFLYDLLEALDRRRSAVDSRCTVVFTVSGVTLGLFMTQLKSGEILYHQNEPWRVAFSAAILFFLLLASIYGLSLIAPIARPRKMRRAQRGEPSLSWFYRIAEADESNYLDLVLKQTPETILKETANQVFKISCLLRIRYERLDRTCRLLYAALSFLAVYVLLTLLHGALPMKFQFLGTGSAINTDSLGSSALVNDSILIDAPGGIAQQLFRIDYDLGTLTAIFITHAHGDHIFGLPFLLMEYMLIPRESDLNVYGPVELEGKINQLTRIAFPEAEPERLLGPSRVRYHVTGDGFTVKIGDISISAHRVPHGPVETYGFRLETRSGSRLFYAPDAEFSPTIQTHVETSQVAVLDATAPDVIVPGHMSLLQLRDLAREHTEVKIFATHRGRYDTNAIELPANLAIAQVGDVISI
jgi:ribonuclease BN (tRNA processing enzyme)